MRLTDTEMEKIVRSELPGYRVVSRAAVPLEAADNKGRKRAKAEAVSPSLTDLKKKYLKGRSPLVARSSVLDADAIDVEADEIVVVEKEGPIDSASAPSRKRLVISSRDRRVTGMQG